MPTQTGTDQAETLTGTSGDDVMKYKYKISPFGSGWSAGDQEGKMTEMFYQGWEVYHISDPVPLSYEFQNSGSNQCINYTCKEKYSG